MQIECVFFEVGIEYLLAKYTLLRKKIRIILLGALILDGGRKPESS
jgi:hypothetical protein